MAVIIGSKNEKLGVIADRPYWMVPVSIVCRAVHQLGAAVFLATYLLQRPEGSAWQVSLAVAAISGCLLLFVEAVRHRQFLREVFGLATILKAVLIGLGHHGWLPPIPAVVIAFLMASLISHAPKAIRHRLLF